MTSGCQVHHKLRASALHLSEIVWGDSSDKMGLETVSGGAASIWLMKSSLRQAGKLRIITIWQKLAELCDQLAQRATDVDKTEAWPAEQLRLCGEYGVFRWFMPAEFGGFGWSDLDVIRGYLRLSAACLTTTFIITQRTGACQRVAG